MKGRTIKLVKENIDYLYDLGKIFRFIKQDTKSTNHKGKGWLIEQH